MRLESNYMVDFVTTADRGIAPITAALIVFTPKSLAQPSETRKCLITAKQWSYANFMKSIFPLKGKFSMMKTNLLVVDTGSVDPSTPENVPEASFGPAGATWRSLARITSVASATFKCTRVIPIAITVNKQ